ncbi:MAG: hypothetical protein EBZ59_05285 [Planctomycetia bacterium]|nr:hypothetical protein [Planctomycetia bacterium]
MLGGLIAAVSGLAALVALASHVPSFYRDQPFPPPAAVAGTPATSADLAVEQQRLEQLTRRMVTKASSLHAAIGRGGSWGAAFSAAEVNAWLAVDLPRNHARLLPRGIAGPRVRFQPRRLLAGARVGAGAVSVVAWSELEIRLRDVNQLGIVLERAGLGAIPLPTGPLLWALARRLSAMGTDADVRRLDGRMVLVVTIPSSAGADATSRRLESLSLGEDEVILAGTTRTAATVAGR